MGTENKCADRFHNLVAMEISLLDPPAEIRPAETSAVDALLDGKVEKISDFSTLGTMDEAMMEIVDTTNNNHYMLMANANSALKDIEPQVRVVVHSFPEW